MKDIPVPYGRTILLQKPEIIVPLGPLRDGAFNMVRPAAVDEDRANLEVLNSNLNKTQELTSQVAQLLSGFDDRLEKMERAMRPIHLTTKRLETVNSNVDATLAAIQKTKQYWTIPGEEEPTITAGPFPDIDPFLASINRLNRGQAMLKATGDQSSQKIAQRIIQLLASGFDQLREVNQSIINEHAGQIEPLGYIMKQQPFPTYSREQVNYMSKLARFANDPPHDGTLKPVIHQDYISMRSTYMQKSLYTFVLASQRNLEIRTTSLYDRENNGIGHYTEALLQMSLGERSLCNTIFGEIDGPEVHNRVVASTFADYSSAIKAITAHVKARLGTDCYLGFETLENMRRLSESVQDIDMPETARELHSNFSTLAAISATAFFELPEDIKRKAGALLVLPPDGSVVDVVKELCARLRKFVDYPQIVVDLLHTLGEGGWRRSQAGSQPLKVNNLQSDTSIESYSAEVIETLLHVLEQKGRAIYKRLNLIGIFMLNNATYIQVSIQRTEMSRYMSARPLGRIEEYNKKAFKIYRESWDIPAKQLMDTTIMRPQDAKSARNSLTTKDKDAVKERFKQFNQEFDESIRACKTFSIVDADLKQALTSQVRSIIVPLYSRFYDKYVNTDFTKNKEKYIKYTRESIEKAVWDSFS